MSNNNHSLSFPGGHRWNTRPTPSIPATRRGKPPVAPSFIPAKKKQSSN